MVTYYFLFCGALSIVAAIGVGSYLDRIFNRPIYVFMVGMAFIYGFMPGIKELAGLQSYPFPYSDSAKIDGLACSLLYASSAILAYYVAGGGVSVSLPQVRSFTSRERQRVLLWLGLPSLVAVIYLIKIIGGYDLASYLRDRIALRRGMGPLVTMAFTAMCYAAILITNYLAEKREGRLPSRARLLVILGVTVALALAFVVMGNRNFVFTLLGIILFAVLSLYRGRLGKATLVLPVLLAVGLGMSAWAKVRTSLDSGRAADVLQEQSATDLLVYGLNGAFGNSENLIWLSEYDDMWDPLYGKTVYAALVNPIPRMLWRDKPFGGGPELRNMIYPGSYTLGGEKMTSYTTGLPTEAYMNFGIVGILFFGSVNGLSLAAVRNIYSRRRITNAVGVVLYSFAVFMLSFGFLYMELLGGWSRFLIAGVMLSFVLWLGDRRISYGR